MKRDIYRLIVKFKLLILFKSSSKKFFMNSIAYFFENNFSDKLQFSKAYIINNNNKVLLKAIIISNIYCSLVYTISFCKSTIYTSIIK